MVEVNESIVNSYFSLVRDCISCTNVKVYLAKEETGKKSSGWTDIDVLAFDAKSKTAYVTEVKGWHNEKFVQSYEKYQDGSIFNNVLKNKESIERKVKQILGRDITIKHVLVIPRYNNEFKEIAIKKGFSEVLGFFQILGSLIEEVKINISYNEECLQMIRLLKNYKFLKK